MNDQVTRMESSRRPAASQSVATRDAEADAQPAYPAPPHDEIERRAYEIYIESGCKSGHCRENWEQAERELRQNSGARDSPQCRADTSDQDEDEGPVIRTFPDAVESIKRGSAST